MRRLWAFVVISVIVEMVAISAVVGRVPGWVIRAIVGLTVLYLLFVAGRGWRKQVALALPPAMSGKVVRRRHWRMF